MHLTDRQISDIRDSYATIKSAAGPLGLGQIFYNDLFQRDPKLRSLFRRDLSEQGMAFMTAIEAIVDNLDAPGALDDLQSRLGAAHAPFHIRPESYRAMEDSLIDTMTYALGARFTNPVELAWRSAFSQFGAAMIEKGRQHADASAGQ